MSAKSRLKARATYYACKAANTAQLAACYREEAEGFKRTARALDPEGLWETDDDGHAPPKGLPGDWIGIADLDENAAVDLLDKAGRA